MVTFAAIVGVVVLALTAICQYQYEKLKEARQWLTARKDQVDMARKYADSLRVARDELFEELVALAYSHNQIEKELSIVQKRYERNDGILEDYRRIVEDLYSKLERAW